MSRPQPLPGGARAAAPAATTSASIDPVKLLKKYALLLTVSGIFGLGLGIGSFLLLREYRPLYRSSVQFECRQEKGQIESIVLSGSEQELERFQQTQVAFILSPTVLERVANDDRVVNQSTQFGRDHMDNGSYDASKALETLEEDVISARVVSKTSLVEASAVYTNKVDAELLARVLRETYLAQLRQLRRTEGSQQRDLLQRQVRDTQQSITELQGRRDRILRDENIESLELGQTESQRTLGQITQELTQLRLDIEATDVQLERLEAQMKSPAGITYGDDLIAQVSGSPVLAGLRAQITSLETEIDAARQRGLGAGHRTVKGLQARLDATRAKLDARQEEELRTSFDSLVELTRQALIQFQAQEADLMSRLEESQLRLNELTRTITEITDIEREIDRQIDETTRLRSELGNLTALAGLDSFARVVVAQPERIADNPFFPQIHIMAAAGIIVAVGLVGSLVVGREVLDQRVKGASDVAIIPRLRVLGVIPNGIEDPTNPKRVETVMRDSPTGVLAESFRQVRSPLIKALDQGGHKTLLVCSGMPRSGSTTVTANLATVLAAGERRVLIIDGNLRRPSLHAAFDREPAPGLADVLAGQTDFADALQQTETEGVTLMGAGAPDLRVFERLGAPAMDRVLSAAREQFDLVLVDAAPFVVAGDASAIANRVDASLLVVRAMAEKRGMVARLSNELNDARAEYLGVVVNAARSAAGGYMRRNIRASHEYQKAKR
ncbi:MAG: polysaccharide biosynthesis tyrosine autokinase [Planctomycetota bacterium]